MTSGNSGLSEEAQELYEAAKAAAMSGSFGVAERKHLASGIIYQNLGENDLAARALMRALWYKIQRHSTDDATGLIDQSMTLSPIQTACGLFQAIEFALFEGSIDFFEVALSSFRNCCEAANLTPFTEHDDVTKWGGGVYQLL